MNTERRDRLGAAADVRAADCRGGDRRAPRLLRLPRHPRVEAQLGADRAAPRRGERRPAGDRADPRHAGGAGLGARQPRLAAVLARDAQRHERPGRRGVRPLSLPRIVLRVAARRRSRARSSSTARTAIPPGWPARRAPIAIPSSSSPTRRSPHRCWQRIQHDVAAGRRYSIFDTTLHGEPYQIVARLQYPGRVSRRARDNLRLHRQPRLGPALLLLRDHRPGDADRQPRRRREPRGARRPEQLHQRQSRRHGGRVPPVSAAVLRPGDRRARPAGGSRGADVAGAGERRQRSDAGLGHRRRPTG